MKFKIRFLLFLFCFVFGQQPTIDDNIHFWFSDFASRSPIAKPSAQFVSDLGSPIAEISAFSAVWIGGHFSNEKSLLRLGKNGICALSISGISTEIIKHLASRERPKIAENSAQWHGPKMFFSRYFSVENPDDFSSFPSGHSALAWATATVISEHFDKKWISILAYSSAFTVSISRIILEEHWTSDVIFGAGIGCFVAKNIENKHFQILPKITQTQQGIEIIAIF